MRVRVVQLGLFLAAFGCGEDDEAVGYLGAVDGGAPPDLGQPDVVSREPVSVVAASCSESSVISMGDGVGGVRGISAFESLGVVVMSGEVRVVRLGSDGCPGGLVESFGDGGVLLGEVSSAVGLPGGRLLYADHGGMRLLDSVGSVVDECVGSDGPVVSRVLGADGDGRVVGVFTKSPLMRVDVGLGVMDCEVDEVVLDPAPHAVMAVGVGLAGGFVTVEQASSGASLVVARYGDDGVRVGASVAGVGQAGGRLCSASGVFETEAGVFVVDSTCRRGLLFDAGGLGVVGIVEFGGVPKGLAGLPGGRDVLVVVELVGQDAGFLTVRFE